MALDLNSLNVSGLSQYAREAAGDSGARTISDAKEKVNKAKASDNEEEINEELMDACKQFEAYLMEQVYKGYENTVKVFSKDKEDKSLNTLVDYFKDITIQDITTTQSETQSTGLAQMLYENMKRNYDL